MILTFITWPANFATSSLEVAGYIIGDLGTPLAVLLGVVVVAIVIGALAKFFH